VFERVLGGRLILRARSRCRAQTRIDVVLLSTAIPRRGHLGSNPTNAVVSSDEPFTRCGDGLVPLRVTRAMALRGLAHRRDEPLLTLAGTRVKLPSDARSCPPDVDLRTAGSARAIHGIVAASARLTAAADAARSSSRMRRNMVRERSARLPALNGGRVSAARRTAPLTASGHSGRIPRKEQPWPDPR
jgi:hypothetical protein